MPLRDKSDRTGGKYHYKPVNLSALVTHLQFGCFLTEFAQSSVQQKLTLKLSSFGVLHHDTKMVFIFMNVLEPNDTWVF